MSRFDLVGLKMREKEIYRLLSVARARVEVVSMQIISVTLCISVVVYLGVLSSMVASRNLRVQERTLNERGYTMCMFVYRGPMQC